MRAATQAVCATLLIAGCTGSVQAQPVKLVEELAERMLRQDGRLLARELAQQGTLLRESEEAAQLLARRSAPMAEEGLLSRFNRLQGVDDSLRAEFRALAPAEQRLAIELGEGVQVVLRRYPEEGMALLQELDASGVAQARTYGDFVLEGAHWLHTDEVTGALRSTKLTSEEAASVSRILGLKTTPEALQAEHIAPLWKSLVRKSGEGAGVFWKTYVQPHKGKWLTGGLLATYLIMPEKFHDAAGNLTEYAIRKLSELGISAATGAARGMLAVLVESFKKHYAEDPIGTVFTLVLITGLVLLAVPAVRRLLWQRVVRRVWPSSRPAERVTTASYPQNEALRE